MSVPVLESHACKGLVYRLLIIILRVENVRNNYRPYPQHGSGTGSGSIPWHGSIVDVERVGDEHDHVRQFVENSLVGLMVVARPARTKKNGTKTCQVPKQH